MAYVVAHARKVKTAVGLRNVARHNCREAVYDGDWQPLGELPKYISHPERAAMNEGDRCGGLVVLKRRSDQVRETKFVRAPQKNAAAAIEFSISASPEWFEGRKLSEWRAYFKDCRTFLAEKYGKENLLHWAVHCDEKTPHMHVVFLPIVKRKDGPAYSSSSFLGGRAGLQRFQSEIAEQVGAKYGIDRGCDGSKARHTDQAEWAAKNAHETARLAEKEKKLAEKEKRIAEREEYYKKIAAKKLKSFKPVIHPKPKRPDMFTNYTLSNGEKVDHYSDYVKQEMNIQVSEYVESVEETCRSLIVKADQYEKAALKTVPALQQQVEDLVAKYNKTVTHFNSLTPAQLRSAADVREAAAKVQGPELGQGKDRDDGGRGY